MQLLALTLTLFTLWLPNRAFPAERSPEEVYSGGNMPIGSPWSGWVGDSLYGWSETERTDSQTAIRFRFVDTNAPHKSFGYEKAFAGEVQILPLVELSGDKLLLFIQEHARGLWHRATLSTEGGALLAEEVFSVPLSADLWNKSVQGTVLWEQPTGSGRWPRMMLFDMEAPHLARPLLDRADTRYAIVGGSWSPSGEYFVLGNRDALGMDRFGSLSELIGTPYAEWPPAFQYDVFKKDGSFVFSFEIAEFHREDGSSTDGAYWWFADDKLAVYCAFYDETLYTMDCKEWGLDASGQVLYEKIYEDELFRIRPYRFEPYAIRGDGYYEVRPGADGRPHLICTSLLDKSQTDFGPMGDSVYDHVVVSTRGTFAALLDHREGVNTLDVRLFRLEP